MVLAAYREAVNIQNIHGLQPIHLVVDNASVDVMKMIAEENMSNLSVNAHDRRSVAHQAVLRFRLLEHLQYIHSVMSELLFAADTSQKTPLHFLITYASYNNVYDEFDDVSNQHT